MKKLIFSTHTHLFCRPATFPPNNDFTLLRPRRHRRSCPFTPNPPGRAASPLRAPPWCQHLDRFRGLLTWRRGGPRPGTGAGRVSPSSPWSTAPGAAHLALRSTTIPAAAVPSTTDWLADWRPRSLRVRTKKRMLLYWSSDRISRTTFARSRTRDAPPAPGAVVEGADVPSSARRTVTGWQDRRPTTASLNFCYRLSLHDARDSDGLKVASDLAGLHGKICASKLERLSDSFRHVT